MKRENAGCNLERKNKKKLMWILGCFLFFLLICMVIRLNVVKSSKEDTQEASDSNDIYTESGLVEITTEEEKSTNEETSQVTLTQEREIVKSENGGYLVPLSVKDIPNDEKLNEIKIYIENNIFDDFFEGGEHFIDHFAYEMFELSGYVGYNENLLYQFTEFFRHIINNDFIYVLNVEDMGFYYRIIMCAADEPLGYGYDEYGYYFEYYNAFYASVYEINDVYKILPFDYEAMDVYCHMFGCGKNVAATNIEKDLAAQVLERAISSGVGCSEVRRDYYNREVAKCVEKEQAGLKEGELSIGNRPGVYKDVFGMEFVESPTITYIKEEEQSTQEGE